MRIVSCKITEHIDPVPWLRGAAAFLGALALFNVFAGLAVPGFNANGWWLDLRPAPRAVEDLVLTVGGAALLAFAAGPRLRRPYRRAVASVILVLALLALRNVVQFYGLLGRGTIGSAVGVPLSLPLAFLLAGTARLALAPPTDTSTPRHRRRRAVAIASAALCCAAAAPLLGVLFFGTTDYRRPADVAVVFGARAYADGRPSDALADRVRTACDLYHRGLVNRLLFSGGPGDGPVHETESMRRLARQLGVPDDAILLDRAGLNTRATVRNAESLLRAARPSRPVRVLAVSHGYHLPRVKMCFRRHGWEVYTVPAKERYTLRKMPLLVAREVVASWAYYFAPLVTPRDSNPGAESASPSRVAVVHQAPGAATTRGAGREWFPR